MLPSQVKRLCRWSFFKWKFLSTHQSWWSSPCQLCGDKYLHWSLWIINGFKCRPGTKHHSIAHPLYWFLRGCNSSLGMFNSVMSWYRRFILMHSDHLHVDQIPIICTLCTSSTLYRSLVFFVYYHLLLSSRNPSFDWYCTYSTSPIKGFFYFYVAVIVQPLSGFPFCWTHCETRFWTRFKISLTASKKDFQWRLTVYSAI